MSGEVQEVKGETPFEKFCHKVKIAKDAGHYVVLTPEEGEALIADAWAQGGYSPEEGKAIMQEAGKPHP